MSMKNTSESYGTVTKLFHLIIAVAFVTQYVLVYWRENVPKENSLNLELILLHKSMGFTLLFIGLSFIIWRFLNTKPKYPSSMARWEVILATATHHTLYLFILLMPLSGTMMSFLSGRGIKWFGIDVPIELTINKPIAGTIYNAHVYMANILIVLVALHIIGALKHHYMDKNNVMTRMWKW